jgi:hypothetical protein
MEKENKWQERVFAPNIEVIKQRQARQKLQEIEKRVSAEGVFLGESRSPLHEVFRLIEQAGWDIYAR